MQMAELSSDLIGLCDPDGKLLFLNPAGRRLIGIEDADIYPSHLSDYVVPEQRHLVLDLIVGVGLGALGLFLTGLLAFTLVEYLVHRYVYHIPATTPGRAKFQYTMHGVHHEYPKDKTRLAMPPILTVFVASLLFFIFRFTLGNAAFGVLAGFVFGYACYLFVHYSLHVFAPPRNALKWLWHHHAMHHYTQESAAFGVCTTLWDHVFGTMPRRRPR